ncbi:hypothetical protein GCM10007049_31420 [Echinicola pacifica]|uniref:Amidinotransferase n=1 Tax=Echinicola pacifica TaxID=346377 RepID=A0A918Q8S6_9BACT|nr:arginine deiminase-related protein [Echinicola pacifica]GGZ35855.1 hypothetical protein GCM10007049_31420 [Echinicola pacifica]
MRAQVSSAILMVRPAAFGANPETALDNGYQMPPEEISVSEVQVRALAEFDQMVSLLRAKDINVMVVEDTELPNKPDAIFPNNWFSTHADGRLIYYPMLSNLRRKERRNDLVDLFFEAGFRVEEIVDLTFFEDDRQYLESTGSMVLDRQHKIAYACKSDRTHPEPLHYFQQLMGYKLVEFTAVQQLKAKKKPIYHTNVMMHIGEKLAVVCLDSIERLAEKLRVKEQLEQSGKVVLPITIPQKFAFAGNMLEVQNSQGKHYTVLSKTAYNSLKAGQKHILSKYTDLIMPNIPTIEMIGGGGVRCMMGEIFLPQIK